jgi:hypothetical protein
MGEGGRRPGEGFILSAVGQCDEPITIHSTAIRLESFPRLP